MNFHSSLLLALAALVAMSRADTVVYQNNFNGAAGTSFPEWSSAGCTWAGNGKSGSGRQPITSVDSPNRAQRFLGEFGGAQVVAGPPFVRVDETVTLTLKNLPPHTTIKLTFDLHVLKS